MSEMDEACLFALSRSHVSPSIDRAILWT
jgi:hypothetical protein